MVEQKVDVGVGGRKTISGDFWRGVPWKQYYDPLNGTIIVAKGVDADVYFRYHSDEGNPSTVGGAWRRGRH